jgi:hypothetical protein
MATYTADDLANIRACIASAVMKTRFADGREVTYHSLDQLLAAEKAIATQVELGQTSTDRAVRRKFGAFRSGC